jgi:hypothetical protein
MVKRGLLLFTLLATSLACAGAPPLPTAAPAPGLPADTSVFGLVVDGTAKAYPFDALAKAPLTLDTVGDKAVVLIADATHKIVRAAERGDRVFTSGRVAFGINFLADQDGVPWRLDEKVLANPDRSRSFPVLFGELTTWGAWSRTHPDSLIYSSADSGASSQPR